MIIVNEVTKKNDLKTFVKFPFQLYKNSEYWVPPIINEELESMDKDKNPVFKNAEARFFLAYKDNKVVGRIAAIVNWVEVKEQQKKKIRFGWFDTVDDIEVTSALLEKVYEIGREQQLEYIEGPVGFSNMDKAGMLTEGFEELNTMITWYNYPYYKDHFEQLGFEKAAEWVEYRIDIPDSAPEKVTKFSKMVMERYKLKLLIFKSSKEIIPYVDEMFGLLNKTYNSLQTFVPIQQYQIDHYKEKYIRYIHPEFINCVTDETGKLIAFAITMPSFSKALQKVNGKLFPFGFIHILRAQKKNDTASFYLIGIDPEYQNKGVTAIIFKEMLKVFHRRGITRVETNPELEENKAIQALWNSYDHRLHKRRRTYRKTL
ncbi:GNAT family N-acetyltransferase [Leptobacterium flavescens]|uniref:GNAT family N-acetyltransferase n=1 Tax=Leptobacterium flavescens TaxID=472055 RepID=A0A6P0UKT7_9FLAO|nr:GNAT family N-acetyltransferase [Leptobacterium flavescens]NER13834.1 GNAT family N-acetyltransferase [Leptobacterium flavescens]